MGSVTDQEFYYEFTYKGTLGGSHFTVTELSNQEDVNFKMDVVDYIKSKKSTHVYKQKIDFVDKLFTNKLQRTQSDKLIPIKSFGCLPPNVGEFNETSIEIPDDILRNGRNARWYNRTSPQLYKQNSNLEDEIEVDWYSVREGVSFHYPTIKKTNNYVTMSIYATNHRYNDTDALDTGRWSQIYIPDYILATIRVPDSLNGEIVRLTLNTGEEHEFFYEFIFNGTEGGTRYTLDELSITTSPITLTPLLVRSPELENCRVKIFKDSIKKGKNLLHIALVDGSNIPIDGESVIELYNNPSFYETLPRSVLVNKSFTYSGIKSEFGTSISASSDYLVIGNPSDRKYTPLSDQRRVYKSGAVFLYKIEADGDIRFLEKMYGEENSEVYFDSRFGCDVSVVGNNFIVGGFADEYSEISLVQSGSDKKLEIEDFESGRPRSFPMTHMQQLKF